MYNVLNNIYFFPSIQCMTLQLPAYHKFKLENLPKEYQNASLKEAIHNFSKLVVKIHVTDDKGVRVKTGSGWIISSVSIPNDDGTTKNSVHVITGTNVVDHNDINKHTVSVLFVLNRNTVKIDADKIMKINKTGNRVRLSCPTCPGVAAQVKQISNDVIEAQDGVLKCVQKQYGGNPSNSSGLAVSIGYDCELTIVIGEVTEVTGEGDFLAYCHTGQIPSGRLTT